MKLTRQIQEGKVTRVWLAVCVGATGLLYLASVALLAARILPV